MCIKCAGCGTSYAANMAACPRPKCGVRNPVAYLFEPVANVPVAIPEADLHDPTPECPPRDEPTLIPIGGTY